MAADEKWPEFDDMSQKNKRKHAAMTAEVVPIPSTALVGFKSSSSEEDSSEKGENDEKKIKLAEKEHMPRESKTPEEINKFMEETFDVRRSFIDVEMPGIPSVIETYPYLFTSKQMLSEFQRITKVDLDHTIQEYCVKYALGIIESAKSLPKATPIFKQADAAKQDNIALRQYWEMVTALCLLPLVFNEDVTEMIREIKEDEEVDTQGQVVPILISKGSIFKSDEFFLVAEETILQEFEEFTMAFATLFASYWVFNMQFPHNLYNTYNFVQKAILHVRDGTPIPPQCKQLQQKLQTWARRHGDTPTRGRQV
ncbi:hypothetical protein LOTGIDRAFT_170653 [Lottia gigantea]|uniref:Uncharacterized protein n=1 Tax=Lottia gigantea TaxID=225164 RepID=V4AK34_LOTGI|nr:hypothetical protein LOTGIDRAFT_170653 [Lottia gigantea]ESP04559.1 hypothetical protein LOTGIDRAFT_170653 [Lottia gigantea]